MTKRLKDVVRRGMMQKIADTLRAGEQVRSHVVCEAVRKQFPDELAALNDESTGIMLAKMFKECMKHSEEVVEQVGAQYELGLPVDLVERLPPAVAIPEGGKDYYWRATASCTDDELRLAAEELERHARETWAKAAAVREYLHWRGKGAKTAPRRKTLEPEPVEP